jgi:hypothetical protein
MKTLRECELEQKIHDLEFRLVLAQKNTASLGRLDDVDYSKSIEVGYGELPMAARVCATFLEPRLSVVLESIGNQEKFQHAYYIDRSLIADKFHLEQALVSMHEKLIYQILQSRNKP